MELIPGFRADPQGKYGGKDGLETKPLQLEASVLAQIAEALARAKSLGMPSQTPEQFVNRVLVEGREDGGLNGLNSNNPEVHKLYQRLLASGETPRGSAYAAMLLEKAKLSKKLGISEGEAWNGVGVNAYGMSGKDYQTRTEQHASAATAEKNKPLLEAVTRYMQEGRTPVEHLREVLPDLETYKATSGGVEGYDNFIKGLFSKQASTPEAQQARNFWLKTFDAPSRAAGRRAFHHVLSNNYREQAGVPTLPPYQGSATALGEMQQLFANPFVRSLLKDIKAVPE